jgi:hypothetical protein
MVMQASTGANWNRIVDCLRQMNSLKETPFFDPLTDF